MYYYNARYYDPEVSAFTRPDPAMDGLNHYGYVNGNPVMYNDPTGKVAICLAVGISLLVSLAFTVVITQHVIDAVDYVANPPEISYGEMTPIPADLPKQIPPTPIRSIEKDDAVIADPADPGVEMPQEYIPLDSGYEKEQESFPLPEEKDISDIVMTDGADVTEGMIRNALKGAELKALQGAVSLPMIQRYVDKLLSGSKAPPISVDDGKIVDGHHRFIAARLLGLECETKPGTAAHGSKETEWDDVKIDPVDWENP